MTDSHDDAALTPELAADVRARFGRGEACRHCGGLHPRSCPRVKRMAFHPNGTLAEVEFWPDGQWSDDNILWPEELPQPEEDTE